MSQIRKAVPSMGFGLVSLHMKGRLLGKSFAMFPSTKNCQPWRGNLSAVSESVRHQMLEIKNTENTKIYSEIVLSTFR